jgi:diazepam-binding inhibitor (GABA receptor modulating acyl-CoA-binding protein)
MLRSMALDDDFASAKTRVEKLPKTPTSDELLELYSLYKQATLGDVSGSRPGMLDFKGRAKYDAWATRRGTAKDTAKQAYVDAVARLEKKYA